MNSMLASRLQVLSSLALAFILVPPIKQTLVCLEGHPSVDQEYKRAFGVLIGHAVAERAVPESKDYLDGTAYSVRVDEVLQGKLPDSIEVFSENTSGRFPMDVGRKYLLFLYRVLGRTVVDNCGNSGLLSVRAAVVDTVRRLERQSSRDP